LSPPLSTLDVDQELWEVLDLCSDEELEMVYNILHSNSPFSPVVKSIVTEKEPALVELRGRVSVMHKVESRFRFLAADPACLLQGKRPGYREALLAIRDRVDVRCSSNLSTYDLETEIFLHILQNCLEYVQGEGDPNPSEAASVALMTEEHGDGMGSNAPWSSATGRPNWTERITAPFRFGVKELLPTLVKFGSALTVTAVGQGTVQKLGGQLISQHIRYQAALKAATGAARGAMAGLGKQVALEAAQKGVMSATARYSAVQGALAFLGPVMWGWLAVDLALKAIGTDYARVIRAVFVLAQVRLVRTQGFSNPQSGNGVEGVAATGGAAGAGAVRRSGPADPDGVVVVESDDMDEYGDPGAAYPPHTPPR